MYIYTHDIQYTSMRARTYAFGYRRPRRHSSATPANDVRANDVPANDVPTSDARDEPHYKCRGWVSLFCYFITMIYLFSYMLWATHEKAKLIIHKFVPNNTKWI